jgi:hypothetical protein
MNLQNRIQFWKKGHYLSYFRNSNFIDYWCVMGIFYNIMTGGNIGLFNPTYLLAQSLSALTLLSVIIPDSR